jgi:hypothetical protein
MCVTYIYTKEYLNTCVIYISVWVSKLNFRAYKRLIETVCPDSLKHFYDICCG